MLESLAVQFLNGLAGASTLFLIAVGLSLIFGVTRIVNFAHGSMYMIGLYVAVAFSRWASDIANLSPWLGFWGGIVVAAVVVGLLGAIIEVLVLRRMYVAPELFQLLATFAVVLILRDGVLFIFGAEDLLGPKAPALKGAIDIFGIGTAVPLAFYEENPLWFTYSCCDTRSRNG
jgi:branched-chain amino acid transport system permease protein